MPDLADVADPLVTKESGTYTHEGENNFRLRNVVLDVAVPLTHGGHPSSNTPGRRKEDDYNLVACFDETQITHAENRSLANPDTAALATTARPPAIASVFKPSHYTRGKDGAPADVTPPLSHDADKGDQDPVAYDGTRVRRLTPRECERLQGFRDDYTLIKYRGKPASDTARYAALGNSMAVPVMAFIGRRIQEVASIKEDAA